MLSDELQRGRDKARAALAVKAKWLWRGEESSKSPMKITRCISSAGAGGDLQSWGSSDAASELCFRAVRWLRPSDAALMVLQHLICHGAGSGAASEPGISLGVGAMTFGKGVTAGCVGGHPLARAQGCAVGAAAIQRKGWSPTVTQPCCVPP